MFPCPAGCVLMFGRQSSSSNRSSRRTLGSFWGRCVLSFGRAAAAAGGFYVSFYKKCYKKLVENYCFSRVLDDTLGTCWARFWRRSILQGHVPFFGVQLWLQRNALTAATLRHVQPVCPYTFYVLHPCSTCSGKSSVTVFSRRLLLPDTLCHVSKPQSAIPLQSTLLFCTRHF